MNMNTLSLFLLITTMVACTKTTSSIQIAGSSTVLPIASIASEQFMASHPNIQIIVNGGGSGVGANQLGQGRIDIGMISRDISTEERSLFAEKDIIMHVIARDAVVPVVSSEIFNAGITALTLQQIAAIYKGEINNWKQLNGPDKEILAIDKEKSRGTRHVFMHAVFADKHALTPGADLVLGSNNEEQTAIAQSDAAIGMLSQAWLNNDVRGLSIITESGKRIEPSLENIANGSYPISRNLALVTAGKPSGLVEEFINYIRSSEGQRIVKKAGYIAYSN